MTSHATRTGILLSSTGVVLLILAPIGVVLAGDCGGCQRTDAPLEPIPDPNMGQPAASSFSVPANLDVGDKYHIIFATSFTAGLTSDTRVPPSFPEFGGLDAADWDVTFAAFNASLPGMPQPWNGLDLVYQAVLSISGNNARDRTAIMGPVYNTNGDRIADDAADLWDGSIQNPVGYDQQGNPVGGSSKVWTGTAELGDYSVDLGAESGRGRQAMIVRATIEVLAGREPVRPIDRWQSGQPKTTESVTYPYVLRDVP